MQFIIIQKLALPRRGRPSGTAGATHWNNQAPLFTDLFPSSLYRAALFAPTADFSPHSGRHGAHHYQPRASPRWKEWPLALDAGIRCPGRGPSLALLKSDASSSWALLPYHPPWQEGAYCNIFPLCMGCGFLSLPEGGKGRKTTKS